MREIVGTAELLTEQEFMDRGYECAAWWQKVRCAPQKVDLFISDEIGTHTLRFAFEGTVSDADFTSHFGGVPFGGYDKSRDVGRPATYFFGPYAYSILDYAFRGEQPYPGIRLQLDSAKAGIIAHEFDHKRLGDGIKTHYHILPRAKLDETLVAWRKIPEYPNVRLVEIPPALRAEA